MSTLEVWAVDNVTVEDGVTEVCDAVCNDDSLLVGLFGDAISSNREINSEHYTDYLSINFRLVKKAP